jgi:nucleotide-binding universal stress UspA family protein
VSASIGCDIAVLMGADRAAGEGDPIVALFGGGDHEWAALQMAAVLAKGRDATLRLVGSAADLRSGTRDASRLLGTASLVVQRLTNVIAEPSLVEPGGGVLHALDGAGLVVFGVSDRWPAEGLGSLRTAIVEQAPSPVLVLRRGPRSTAPARREGQSRYAWSRAGGITAPMPEGRKTKREPR